MTLSWGSYILDQPGNPVTPESKKVLKNTMATGHKDIGIILKGLLLTKSGMI